MVHRSLINNLRRVHWNSLKSMRRRIHSCNAILIFLWNAITWINSPSHAFWGISRYSPYIKISGSLYFVTATNFGQPIGQLLVSYGKKKIWNNWNLRFYSLATKKCMNRKSRSRSSERTEQRSIYIVHNDMFILYTIYRANRSILSILSNKRIRTNISIYIFTYK